MGHKASRLRWLKPVLVAAVVLGANFFSGVARPAGAQSAPARRITVPVAEPDTWGAIDALGRVLPPDIHFRWADNIQQTGKWSDFYLTGDCAPPFRFYYRAKFRR